MGRGGGMGREGAREGGAKVWEKKEEEEKGVKTDNQ